MSPWTIDFLGQLLDFLFTKVSFHLSLLYRKRRHAIPLRRSWEEQETVCLLLHVTSLFITSWVRKWSHSSPIHQQSITQTGTPLNAATWWMSRNSCKTCMVENAHRLCCGIHPNWKITFPFQAAFNGWFGGKVGGWVSEKTQFLSLFTPLQWQNWINDTEIQSVFEDFAWQKCWNGQCWYFARIQKRLSKYA